MSNSTGGRCTYLVGPNCIDALASCAYTKPASLTTDALAQAACSIAKDTSGKQCGYTSG